MSDPINPPGPVVQQTPSRLLGDEQDRTYAQPRPWVRRLLKRTERRRSERRSGERRQEERRQGERRSADRRDGPRLSGERRQVERRSLDRRQDDRRASDRRGTGPGGQGDRRKDGQADASAASERRREGIIDDYA